MTGDEWMFTQVCGVGVKHINPEISQLTKKTVEKESIWCIFNVVHFWWMNLQKLCRLSDWRISWILFFLWIEKMLATLSFIEPLCYVVA